MTPPPLSYEMAWNQDGTQAFCLRRHLAVPPGGDGAAPRHLGGRAGGRRVDAAVD